MQSKDRVLSVAHLPLLIHSSMGCFWKTFVFVFWDFHQQHPWTASRVTWQISSLADWLWLSFFRSRLQTGCSSLDPFATQSSWTESLSSYLPLPPAGLIGSYILAYSQRGNSNLSLVQLSPFSFSFSPMLVLTFILFLMFTYWSQWSPITWHGVSGTLSHEVLGQPEKCHSIPTIFLKKLSLSALTPSCPSPQTRTHFIGRSWRIAHVSKTGFWDFSQNKTIPCALLQSAKYC